MLSKLTYLSSRDYGLNQNGNKLQLIAMSATLPNLSEMAVWLDACLFVTHFRPVLIREYFKINQEIFNPEGTLAKKLT